MMRKITTMAAGTIKLLGFTLVAAIVTITPVWPETNTYVSAATSCKQLAIPSGTRTISLGQAFIAGLNDVESLEVNPAGLISLNNAQVMIGHQSWIEGISQENIRFGQNIEKFGGVGLGMSFLNFGAIDRWEIDASGNALPTGRSYTPFAFSGRAAWAVPVEKEIAAGAGLCLNYEQIDNLGSLAGALDFGLLYIRPDGLTIGTAVHNLGLSAGDYLLPMNLQVGAGYELPYSLTEKDFFTVYLDSKFKYDDWPSAGMGVEYIYNHMLQARVGWNQNFGHTNANQLGLTCGAGVQYAQWQVEYALAPQGDFGLTHHLSIRYRIIPAVEKEIVKAE